jgi:hypothetical protein
MHSAPYRTKMRRDGEACDVPDAADADDLAALRVSMASGDDSASSQADLTQHALRCAGRCGMRTTWLKRRTKTHSDTDNFLYGRRMNG